MAMAADQRKKRPNAVSVVGCSSRGQYRAKRKNFRSLQHDLKMRSHISLEWDGNQKRVFSRKEQIGITWRCLTPFIDCAPHCHNVLADVFVIPHEILELENLSEVLSYEAWQTHLSEEERNFLMQFLPGGVEAQQVVQALLGGDNFHFGNPFLKWGASLCNGNLHPDMVLHQEQCFKANKKAYYSELHKYHNDIVGNLQKWKERWASCKDPEKEIVQKIWRSRTHAGTNMSSHGNESRFYDPEENFAATSESCSWGADEKACSSDNQNSSIINGGELQEREGFMKDKCGNWLVAPDELKLVGRPRKGDKLNRLNIQCSDGAKYMSYFKISKKQHQLVKNMKQSGNSIQSRSLNCVLGNLDHLNVQPYEVFEEEECKKLNEHWLQLANRDLPAAFANWRKGQLERQQMIKSLEQEMEEKLKSLKEAEEEENCGSMLQEQDAVAKDPEPNEDDEESVPGAIENQPLQQISLLNGSHHFNHVVMDTENHLVMKKDDALLDVSYPGNFNPTDVAVSRGVPLTSSRVAWPVVSASHSYYHSTSREEYASASELPLGPSQVIDEQRSRLIDLESDMNEEEIGKNLLHRQSNDGSLNSYPSQDRDELLQSFFKGRDILSYHHEQRQAGFDFQATTSLLMENDHFPRHFREQLQSPLPLERMHERQTELYAHPNIQENMFSHGSRYFIPRQDHLSPVNMQDWIVNPVHMSAPPQSQSVGGELLSQNLFSGKHRVHGDLSGPDGSGISSQGIGNGSNTDGSLFSVLSHCNELRSGTRYDSMDSMEQLVSPGNYGVVGGGILRSSNVLPQASNPLEYFSGREAASALMSNSMGWISLPHQNSAIHDPMGKSFLRSWNQ